MNEAPWLQVVRRGLTLGSRLSPRQSAIAGMILFGGLVIRLLVAPSYGYMGTEGDLVEQKQAMHRAVTLGIHEVYTPNARNDPALAGGEWQGGYFINYPPVIVYLRAGAGYVYRFFEPEHFELWDSELNYLEMQRTDLGERMASSRGFTVAAKLPGIFADLLISIGLLVFVGTQRDAAAGLAAAAVYAFNPGVIMNTAHWGQHDAVWAGLLILGLFLTSRGRIEAGWVSYALAALTKPQAAPFVLLVVFLGIARSPVRRVFTAAGAVIGTVVLVFLPFMLHGTFVESVTAIVRSVLGGEPYVSCNAANFWWWATGGHGYEFSDVTPILGPLTPRLLGMFAFLTANFVLFRRLRGQVTDLPLVYAGAATLWLVFFSFNTELHENHLMVAVPLLAFALPLDRRFWIPIGVVSFTLLMNLLLFDSVTLVPFANAFGLHAPGVRAITVMVAVLNTLTLIGVGALFWKHSARESLDA